MVVSGVFYSDRKLTDTPGHGSHLRLRDNHQVPWGQHWAGPLLEERTLGSLADSNPGQVPRAGYRVLHLQLPSCYKVQEEEAKALTVIFTALLPQ